jgi:methyl coenzyme M reductase subunit C
VLVSPVVADGVGTGPGLVGSATLVPSKATERVAIASTPVTPPVAEISFNFVVFTHHSKSVREQSAKGSVRTPSHLG